MARFEDETKIRFLVITHRRGNIFGVVVDIAKCFASVNVSISVFTFAEEWINTRRIDIYTRCFFLCSRVYSMCIDCYLSWATRKKISMLLTNEGKNSPNWKQFFSLLFYSLLFSFYFVCGSEYLESVYFVCKKNRNENDDLRHRKCDGKCSNLKMLEGTWLSFG